MKKYIKMKPVGGILITLLTALPLYAQDNNEIVGQNTPAALERMKMQNLWLEHTSNAAGAILDNTVRYSTVSLGYDIGNGTFRRPQEGKRVNSLDFKTEGGGIYEGLHGMYVWGSFSYSRYKVHKAEYNASLIDPLRGMPFIIADTNRSNWVNQDYNLEMQMTTPLLWNRVIIGITGRYQNAVGAKQLDPRPLVRLSQFTVIPSVIVKFDKHALGLNFDYYSRREDGSAGNSNNRRDQQVWELRGLGFHSEGVIGGVGGVGVMQETDGASVGGGGDEHVPLRRGDDLHFGAVQVREQLGIQHVVHRRVVRMPVQQIDGAGQDRQQHIESVCDDLDRHAELLVEPCQHMHHGALAGQVEIPDRLLAHEQFRVASQGLRDGDPLAQTARKPRPPVAGPVGAAGRGHGLPHQLVCACCRERV